MQPRRRTDELLEGRRDIASFLDVIRAEIEAAQARGVADQHIRATIEALIAQSHRKMAAVRALLDAMCPPAFWETDTMGEA